VGQRDARGANAQPVRLPQQLPVIGEAPLGRNAVRLGQVLQATGVHVAEGDHGRAGMLLVSFDMMSAHAQADDGKVQLLRIRHVAFLSPIAS